MAIQVYICVLEMFQVWQDKKFKAKTNCVNRTFLNLQNKIKDKCIVKQQLLATQIVNDE